MIRKLFANFAGVLFSGCVLFTAWNNGEPENYLSVGSIAFLVSGFLFSSLVIGNCLNLLHQRFAWRLMAEYQNVDPLQIPDSKLQTIRFAGTLIMMIQFLAIYFLTDWGFNRWVVAG